MAFFIKRKVFKHLVPRWFLSILSYRPFFLKSLSNQFFSSFSIFSFQLRLFYQNLSNTWPLAFVHVIVSVSENRRVSVSLSLSQSSFSLSFSLSSFSAWRYFYVCVNDFIFVSLVNTPFLSLSTANEWACLWLSPWNYVLLCRPIRFFPSLSDSMCTFTRLCHFYHLLVCLFFFTPFHMFLCLGLFECVFVRSCVCPSGPFSLSLSLTLSLSLYLSHPQPLQEDIYDVIARRWKSKSIKRVATIDRRTHV